MSTLQLFIYVVGIVFFLMGCFFYHISRNEVLSINQKLNRKRCMNFCLIIALICVGYSWL